MFNSTFKRLNIQFEDATLNYVQTKSIGNYKLKSKQIDLFDRTFLSDLNTEIKKKKYFIARNNHTNIIYHFSKPAIAFELYQNESDKTKGTFNFKVSLGGILQGLNKQFILIEDSISSGLIELNQSITDGIPMWAKEKPENCVQLANKDYYIVLEENQMYVLAKAMALKTSQVFEKQFQKDLIKSSSK